MFLTLASAALPVLRRIDPERAHFLALFALRWGPIQGRAPRDHPALAVDVLGLKLSNPIGLAAGFDKNADAGPALMRLGFGFVETGTVTPRPQKGNPKPRIFRLSQDQAVINRLGFNNRGLDVYRKNLLRLAPRTIPLGANIGINKEGADPIRDYPALIASIRPLVDYVVVNVSSPNTPGLRDLQGAAWLPGILRAIRPVPGQPPTLVKVAPDLSLDELAAVVETCVVHGVHGLIIGNTTTSRPTGLKSSHATQSGGLSGVPLGVLSTFMLAQAYLLARGRLVLIGAGGIFSGRDVLTKIQAGASLVQLYTGFAFYGPALIPRLKVELFSALRQEGFKAVHEAVGTNARSLAALSPFVE